MKIPEDFKPKFIAALRSGEYEGNPIVKKLAFMNDAHNSFEEIAQVIEDTEDFV